jgi:hypothetical protein
MKPINSRTKGAGAEREFCRLIHAHLGVVLARNLEQSRNGGHDLIAPGDDPISTAINRYAIECKRYRTITPGLLERFWKQAEAQSEKAGKIPVLAYRADRQDWNVVIPLYSIDPDTFERWSGLQWTATITVEAFCTLVRESI